MYELFDPAQSAVPASDVDLVIFPEFIDGDIGIYRSSLVPLKKQLIEEGIRADFAHPPERRTWLREYSAAERAIDLAIGLTSGGAILGLQLLIARRKPTSQMRVKITSADKVRGRRMWGAAIAEFEGTAEDVGAQVEAWKESSDDL